MEQRASEQYAQTPVEEREIPVTEAAADTNDSEPQFADWGDEQTAFVNLHQDIIVTCPWMDNARVTLGVAMTTYEYPPNLTAEDEPFLMAVVHELLASRKNEDEAIEDTETDVEVEVEEAPEATDEPEGELHKSEGKQPIEESTQRLVDEVSRKAVPPKVALEQSSAQHTAEIHQPQEESSADTQEPSQPESSPKRATSNHINSESPEQPQAYSARPIILESSVRIGDQENEFDQPTDILETTETPKIVIPSAGVGREQMLVAEAKVIPDRNLGDNVSDSLATRLSPEMPAKLEDDDEIYRAEVAHLTAAAKEVALSVSVGGSVDPAEAQPINIQDKLSTRSGEIEVEVEDFPVESTTADRVLAPVTSFIDDDTVIKEMPLVTGKDEKDDSNLWVEVNIPAIEPPAGVEVVADQLLEECIEQTSPEAIEITHHYLEKIVETAAQLAANEEIVDELEVVEELEELFIELFDEMGIPHNPDIIKHLARRTIKRRMAKNKEIEDEEAADDIQQGGLAVLLKRPSTKHVTLNDAIIHNRLISRIALELCGFKASFSLN